MSFNLTAIVIYIIKTFGYAGVSIIVFAESGLLLGFILPGDSLIFVGGLLAAQGYFSLPVLLVVAIVSAIVGDNVGYLIGTRLGRRVFEERNTFIFNPDNLHKTEAFFARYGRATFIIQRFVPIIRAFAPLLAGVGKMTYRFFFWADLVGCILWGGSVTLLGYYLGATIPGVDHYLLPAVVIVVILSLIPTFLTTYRARRRARSRTR